MADLSKIKIPNGTEYNLKDAQARADIESLNGSLGEQSVAVATGTTSLYSDLSVWHNGYISASGELTASDRNITPNEGPVKLDNGKSINVTCGSYICAVGVFEWRTDHFVRKSGAQYTGDVAITSTSDNFYYSLVFKTDPASIISPADFDGRIGVDTDWKKQLDANTEKLESSPDASGLVYAYTDLSEWTQGYFTSNGTLSSSPNMITPLAGPVKMLPGDIIKIDPTPLVATVAIYKYINGGYARQSSVKVSEVTELTYEQTTYVTFTFGKDPTSPTTPSEFAGYIKSQTAWKSQTNENSDRIAALETAMSEGSNVLFGKKLVACGDSITAARNPEGGNFNSYAKLTADRNAMAFEINAVSGSTMTNVEGKSPFCVDRYQNIPSDFDYLTIWFGYNDGAYAQVGTISDTDDTTFYGAYKKVLDYLVAQYPTKKIGIIVPYMNNSAFQEAVRNISEMYGVPCLDLPNGNQCSCVWGNANSAQTARKSALTYDNTHPNQEGHSFISTMYEAFLRRL